MDGGGIATLDTAGYPSVVQNTTSMQIHIDKQSEVPARDQLRQQIIFLIGTGQLPIGMELPSVKPQSRGSKISPILMI